MTTPDLARRDHVLEVALGTFARFGYKKASMDDVARAADISRPGLYFLFTSKQNLFREAVTRALDEDLAAAGRALSDTGRPLRDRLVEAFDHWTGRYVGPMAREVGVLIETNPDLLEPMATDYPSRFAALLTETIAAALPPARADVAENIAATLRSTVAGLKTEAATRQEFVARTTVAVDLLVRALESYRP